MDQDPGGDMSILGSSIATQKASEYEVMSDASDMDSDDDQMPMGEELKEEKSGQVMEDSSDEDADNISREVLQRSQMVEDKKMEDFVMPKQNRPVFKTPAPKTKVIGVEELSMSSGDDDDSAGSGKMISDDDTSSDED